MVQQYKFYARRVQKKNFQFYTQVKSKIKLFPFRIFTQVKFLRFSSYDHFTNWNYLDNAMWIFMKGIFRTVF